jgi:hypothetical protein
MPILVTTLFVRFLVLVLSPPRRTVLVLVLESIQYSNPTFWSASFREPPRSTIGTAAVRKAIEYEYRFAEYRFAEYEYDEIRYEARPMADRLGGSSLLLGQDIFEGYLLRTHRVVTRMQCVCK